VTKSPPLNVKSYTRSPPAGSDKLRLSLLGGEGKNWL
jgi:hypothetical protein